MSWLRPRWTLRSLMIGVAVVALMVGIEVGRRRLVERASRYRVIANQHRLNADVAEASARVAESERELIKVFQLRADDPALGPTDPGSVAMMRRSAAWSRDLASKYAAAAHAPWRTVEPDPPQPPWPPPVASRP